MAESIKTIEFNNCPIQSISDVFNSAFPLLKDKLKKIVIYSDNAKIEEIILLQTENKQLKEQIKTMDDIKKPLFSCLIS